MFPGNTGHRQMSAGPRGLATDDGSLHVTRPRSGKVVMMSLMVTTWTPGHMNLLSEMKNKRNSSGAGDSIS